MRSHTSAHIVSGVFSKKAGALITGNQLEPDKVRIDFNLENFDREKMEGYIREANEIIGKDFSVQISYMTREDAMREGENNDLFKLAKDFSEEIKEVRIVSIGNWDRQADGGTHVKSTKEVGEIKLLRFENKGKANRRIYYELL
jgi:misacylated tRNA(Ala) deacylase